ncbi:MAG: hypothetical protein WAP52_01545, partial [Candidatus Sungiibacteriota bacterium]
RTLFSPFSRIHSGGISITDIAGSAQNITLNLIARAVGFMLRVIVITIGAVSEILLAVLLIIIFIFWLILPFIILFLLAFATDAFTIIYGLAKTIY